MKKIFTPIKTRYPYPRAIHLLATVSIFLLCGNFSIYGSEISFYRFDKPTDDKELGADEHGLNPLPSGNLKGEWKEGGAYDESGYCSFDDSIRDLNGEYTSLHGVDINQPHSVMMWVKPGFLPAETGAVRYFTALGPSVIRLSVMRTDQGLAYFGYSLRKDNKEYLNIFSAFTFPATVDRWYQVAYTYEPGEEESFKFYVDGVLQSKSAVNLFQGRSSILLGAGSGSAGFGGGLDNVKIFDHALSEEEIADAMKGL